MARPRIHHLGVAAAAALLVGLTGLAHHSAERARRAFPVDDDLVYLPRVSVLRLISLGHPEAMADLVFLRTMTYFTGQFFGSRNYDWLQRHIDTVNALDPWFRAPYLFAARAAIYNGRTITNNDVRLANHFLEAGLKRFPSDWELAFTLGCNYLIELQTDDARERDGWRRTAAAWIRQAANSGGGPPWLPNLAATIMSEEGEVEASIRYLEEAYLTAVDDRTREEIRRLLAAKRQSDMERLTAARDAFAAGWRRTFPYAPADLYLLIGDPPSPRLDLGFLAGSAADGDGAPGGRGE